MKVAILATWGNLHLKAESFTGLQRQSSSLTEIEIEPQTEQSASLPRSGDDSMGPVVIRISFEGGASMILQIHLKNTTILYIEDLYNVSIYEANNR